MSCETTQQPAFDGLNSEAQERMRHGDLTGALEQQLTAPGGNCQTPSFYSESFPLVAPYEKERPKKSYSDEKNRAICQKRALWAKANNVDTLTVSFEGLGSFNAGVTNRLYDYYDDLWQGKEGKAPGGLGSHVGRKIIGPHMKDDYKKSDFLMFSERGGAKAVEECVAIYKDVFGPRLKLNIMGLSFGAGEALVLADKLSEKKGYGPHGIEVNNLVTMDLRGSERVGGVGPRVLMNGNFQTPENVTNHMNFGRFDALELAYISPTVGYPGYRSRPSGRLGTRTENILMPTMAGHARQVERPEIQNFYRDMIR